MSHYYILDADGQVQRVSSVQAWGVWFEQASRDGSRVVKQDFIEGSPEPRVGVSTVFLGLDHNFGLSGPPVLWETLVFGTSCDGLMERYATREAALAGHARILREVSEAWLDEQDGAR